MSEDGDLQLASDDRSPAIARVRHRIVRKAVLIIAGAVTTATLVASLVAVRPSPINVTVRATDVLLSSPQKQFLVSDLPVRRVTVEGANLIQPNMIPEWAPEISPAGDTSGLGATLEADSSGELSLSRIPLPAGSEVHIASTKHARTFRVRIFCRSGCKDAESSVVAVGKVNIQSRTFAKSMTFDVARSVRIGFGERPVQIEFELLGIPAEGGGPLGVSTVRFVREEVFSEQGESIHKIVSSIRSGSINHQALAEKSIPLLRGQELHLAIRSGSLTHMTLDSSVVALEFTGTVTSLDRGPNRDNLLPSYLEVLHARIGLHLVLITVLAVVPTLYKVVKWLSDS